MGTFECLNCSATSHVRHVKADTGGIYFFCERCGAEHRVRQVETPRDEPSRFEVVEVRDRPDR
jgi:transcription elongation factor Elf1